MAVHTDGVLRHVAGDLQTTHRGAIIATLRWLPQPDGTLQMAPK